MSDTINREYATRYFIGLQALDKITNDNYDGKITFEEVVSRLGFMPSAEPETPSNGSITCVKSEKMHDRTMDDLISRQAAIDEIDEWIKAFRENGHKESAADACLIQDGIIQLPSAQTDIVRCRDCKWFNDIGCAIRIVDDTDKPSEDDFCSFAERRNDG